MNKFAAVVLTILVVTLVSCRNSVDEPQIQENAPEPATAVAQPDATATVAKSPTAGNPVNDVREKETAEPPAAVPPPSDTKVEQVPENAPTLFPGSWDDRAIYAASLIPDEAGVLQEFSGATVYHMILDISDPTMVEGTMEARYTNQEDEALDELVLHLFPAKLGGDMEVRNIQVNGKAAESAISTAALQIKLPEPLSPGDHVVLALDFVTAVPGEESTKYKVLAFAENILALAHFYPMFAVYDEGGWHGEPSAEHGDETFADNSFYLVQVIAPEDQIIVAGGSEVDQQLEDDQQLVTFAAGPARDFYLVASDNFDVVQQEVGPVLINSYAPPDRISGARMALDVAVHALESYSARFGPYPYSELDIVTTPTSALGVEYPGIFANALRIYDLEGTNEPTGLPNSALVESTTAHETGHQWFYALVGSDQLNEPWLDEAFTQYATWHYFIDRYGERNAYGFYNSLEGRWARAENPDLPIGLPADAYSGSDYAPIVYGRGPIFLNELAELMGRETFDALLRDYSETYRWKIADGEDFLELAEEYCNCDLSELFATQVFGN